MDLEVQEGDRMKKQKKEKSKLKNRQYKAFDFISGNTYLIGEFAEKSEALAYCKTQGWVCISQTVVPLTDEEYMVAYQNRKEVV